MLSQLRELEGEYANELVVIGVHAGKFTAERNTANIRQAILRLEVEHPVVNDRAFRTWRSYAVTAWPTLILIDPEGYVVDVHPGEITADSYRELVARVVDDSARHGTLDRRPLTFRPEAAGEPPHPLAFPEKVLVDPPRLFIADSGHHRLVVVVLREGGASATVELIAGRGAPGLVDGSLDQAAFNRPQGMALQGQVLYVADTESHAVRAIDLPRREVSTVAGTGDAASRLQRAGFALRVPLNSPSDLALKGDGLYIALAGTHQIWRLDLATSGLRPYAGSGFEELADGPNLSAALAQPSGLSAGDHELYVADSEASAIRAISLPAAQVYTIVGAGLFDFGDRDGIGDEVRLQHAQGLTWHDGLLYIADTYNNKIKVLDPQTRQAQTLVGTGEPGWRDGEAATFYEPRGISAAGDRLYVADTNNHVIRIVDLTTRRVSTLEIEGLQAQTPCEPGG